MPHAIAVTTANETDRAGELKAITCCASNLANVESALVDGGYGEPFANAVNEKLGATVQVAKMATNLVTVHYLLPEILLGLLRILVDAANALSTLSMAF